MTGSKKKKSKTNKLARMTEEERIRYLQHRAAMEEEVQRRKQELITTYLQTKLKHEEVFLRLNSAKINQRWRHILRQIKCKELKEDMETLKQRFEVVLECKNKVIEHLLSDFDNAEFQYSLQFKAHMDAISTFLEIHRVRIANLHNWYSQQLQNVLEKNQANEEKNSTEIGNDIDSLKKTWMSRTTESEKKLCQMRANFDEKKNELQTKLLCKTVKLEEKYADELKVIMKKFDEVLKQYKENTDTKYAHYRILAEKDNSDSLQLVRHFEEIIDLTRCIEQAKIEFEEMERKNAEEIDTLNKEKETSTQTLQELQRRNNKNLAEDRKQLKLLVNVSNGIIKELGALVKKYDKMMQLADNCFKLSKKKETFLPEIPQAETSNSEQSSLPYAQFQNFWRIYNETKLSNETLKAKKAEAIEENKRLKKLLHFYMISVRKSSSVPRKCGF